MELLTDSGVQRARSLLTTNSRYGDITPTQYESALRWLERTGLLTVGSDSGAPAAVLVYAQAVTEAGWFPDADVLVRDPGELPSDALSAASALGIEPDPAFDHLRARWGKVDTELRRAVGAAGEAEVLAHLDTVLIDGVSAEQVSACSDGLGYDIAVMGSALEVHLEVKSTTRAGRATFYLSRNEYEVLLRDSCWVLVFAHLSSDLKLAAIETVETAWIRDTAPVDTTMGARWESCRFDAPTSSRTWGIPALATLVRTGASYLV